MTSLLQLGSDMFSAYVGRYRLKSDFLSIFPDVMPAAGLDVDMVKRAAIALLAVLAMAPAASFADSSGLVLHEGAYWRQYYRLGPNRISAAGGQAGAPVKTYHPPFTAPAPPADWASPDFDDSAWTFKRHTFQGDMAEDSKDFIDRGLIAGYYRSRFLVDDPARSGGLTLRAVYRGGMRVFVNGEELTRGYLPAGKLSDDDHAQNYPEAAYKQPSAANCDRTIGPIAIPPQLLRKGVNVLGIEVRASEFHPVVLANKLQYDWCDRERPWPHAHVGVLDLRSAAGGGSGVSGPARPAGVQVWAVDIHHRLQSDEYLPAGEKPGKLQMAAVRNGTFSAQLAVGADKDLRGLQAEVGELRTDGADVLPAGAVTVLYGVPFPLDEFSTAKLGDEKGMGGKFPSKSALAQLEFSADASRVCLFDHLSPTPPAGVPAGTCRPVWLTFRIPAQTKPGLYRGTTAIRTGGTAPVSLPVEVNVLDWTLPDPGEFQTFVACEENPYGVARQYGMTPWSAEHFKLLEASFRQLGRIGNRWCFVPIVRASEFGNRDDSMIRIVRKPSAGALTFDFTLLDKYLDLAAACCGRKPMVCMVVEQGTQTSLKSPIRPEVPVYGAAGGRPAPMTALSGPQVNAEFWTPFGKALAAHMDERGWKGNWCWGATGDGPEDDPNLKTVLAQAAPGVYWLKYYHCLWAGGPDMNFYRYAMIPRFWSNAATPPYRGDKGWKWEACMQLLSPRIDGTCMAITTVSHPFAFRAVSEQALACGRAGICRIAVDGWAGAYFDGQAPRRVPTGLPVLFTLWPGPNGAETSARFEALLEGIQETEARIAIEQAAERGGGPAAARATKFLADRLAETSVFKPNFPVYELEQCYYRWQARSAELYNMASGVAPRR